MAYVTYTGKRGLITTNRATYSEDLTNAAWTKTEVTITADATTSPNGSTTMDRIVEAATTAVHSVSQSFSTLTDSTTYTYSIYGKQGERTWIAIFVTKKDGTTGSAYFNLATGVVGTVSGCTAAIVASSNGSYRCSITADVLTGATVPKYETRLATGDTVSSYLGVITSGAFAWGGQLVAGSLALEYNATTTAQAHAVGSSYSIGFDALSLDSDFTIVSKDHISLGGGSQGVISRIEERWSTKTDIIEETDLPKWREFLKSVAGNETFTFDPYGTTTVGSDGLRTITLSDVKNVKLDSKSWKEEREQSTRKYRISFTVRVI